jgi:hypothetical protein
MARLTRVLQKIFGSTAGAAEIGVFGSLAAGSAATTTDPLVVQSLANYLEGWYGAVIGGNSPTIEDMNALHYLYAYQLAYLFENGVPEWDATTTYYTGDIVNEGGSLLKSLSNTNLNNDPASDVVNWASVGGKSLNPQATPTLASRAGANNIAQTGSATSPWSSICWSPELSIFCAVASGSTRSRDDVS